MMNILITGASGALGRAFLNTIKPSKSIRIFTAGRQEIKVAEHIVSDLTKEGQISKILAISKPDFVFHFAGDFFNDFNELHKINVNSSKEILKFIEENQLKTIVVLMGSAAEYGLVSGAENPVCENHLLKPLSPYGITKAWQSLLVAYYANKGVNVKYARIFNLCGKGLSKRLFVGQLEHQIEQVLNGKQEVIRMGKLNAVRDFISLEDAAQQIKSIAFFGSSGEVYHVGNGVPVSMREFSIMRIKESGITLSSLEELEDNFVPLTQGSSELYANMSKTSKILSKNLLF